MNPVAMLPVESYKNFAGEWHRILVIDCLTDRVLVMNSKGEMRWLNAEEIERTWKKVA